MNTTERVMKHREKQKQAGRKLVSMYLTGDAIKALKSLARPRTQGEVVELAIEQLVAKNGTESAEAR